MLKVVYSLHSIIRFEIEAPLVINEMKIHALLSIHLCGADE
jgi:Zn-dependent M32 family carboxypeptidase